MKPKKVIHIKLTVVNFTWKVESKILWVRHHHLCCNKVLCFLKWIQRSTLFYHGDSTTGSFHHAHETNFHIQKAQAQRGIFHFHVNPTASRQKTSPFELAKWTWKLSPFTIGARTWNFPRVKSMFSTGGNSVSRFLFRRHVTQDFLEKSRRLDHHRHRRQAHPHGSSPRSSISESFWHFSQPLSCNPRTSKLFGCQSML